MYHTGVAAVTHLDAEQTQNRADAPRVQAILRLLAN
jgi:hypothetical protein